MSESTSIYERMVFKKPLMALIPLIVITLFMALGVSRFKLDASSDSIVLEKDAALRYYRSIRQQFGSDDYLILTLTPHGSILTPEALNRIEALTESLKEIPHVDRVYSLLDVPLFESPKVPLFMLASGYKTLRKEGVDLALAEQELINSPMYRDLLINREGTTTGMQVFLTTDPEMERLLTRRSELRDMKWKQTLTTDQDEELKRVEAAYDARRAQRSNQIEVEIAQIRDVLEQYADFGTIHLGGVPMIVADIISYVRHDIVVFGLAVLFILMIILGFIFRDIKWLVLPLMACLITVTIMIGFLGWTDWRATIVTSNFTSLLFIITMSMAIHIAVRYREQAARHKDWTHVTLLQDAIRGVALPCFYCAMTTMVGFGSLIVSGIRPVMDFGLMMVIGIAVGYMVCFIFIPAAGTYFSKGAIPDHKLADLDQSPVRGLAIAGQKHPGWILSLSLLALIVFALGIGSIKVENRFIDYFKDHTPIYTGMTVIDEQLGGTTPLEVILTTETPDYWYKIEHLKQLRTIHQHLDQLEATGKVISLDTMVQMVEKITSGVPINAMVLNLIRNNLPEHMADEVLQPFITKDGSTARIAIRVRESDPTLNRRDLLRSIDDYFATHPIEGVTPSVTGVFVLYNNMLQSLYQSQILTIGTVFIAIFVMFIILFRSVKLAAIAIVPNVLPVILVLGTMGWSTIPLDMMTIMTAAVTLGIAVDFTIHYVHRYRWEFPRTGQYNRTTLRCHASIGRAVFFTSLTILIGFSVFAMSNFIPTIYFGLFTGLAMVMALLASLTLLPVMLAWIKPFGPETQPGTGIDFTSDD